MRNEGVARNLLRNFNFLLNVGKRKRKTANRLVLLIIDFYLL